MRCASLASFVRCSLALLLGISFARPAIGQEPPPVARIGGFVAGTVIDAESGRPLASARIETATGTWQTRTNLDGRFRLALPAGMYSLRAMRIGNAPVQMDSVVVTEGNTTTANFALSSAGATVLQSVAVTAAPVRATSEDALLAMQKSAARVSDGISAEAINRAPGSSASDAIVRVTGVSIVDGKFAFVRGLGERFSNTLLNGVELPSPEPLKKVVPLDLFPSSLLESIVVSKTATPDRPADFAGGSVEVSTKEFPDEPVREFSFSAGYNSQSTFRDVARMPQRGIDWLGFDAGRRRQMPSGIPTQAEGSIPFSPQSEAYAERLRNDWAPAPTPVEPNLSFAGNVGGQAGQRFPFGYVLSTTLNRNVEVSRNRLAQLVFDKTSGIPDQGYVSQEAATVVDLGAMANFAVRLGATNKLGWKNLYTRNAEESFARRTGYETYNGNAERLIQQTTYVTRALFQTQLTGDHLLPALADARIEWKASLALSTRDEPENRSLTYFRTPTQTDFELPASKPSPFWFRFLDDDVRAAQVDVGLPLPGLVEGAHAKGGILYRERNRQFGGYFFRLQATTDPALRPYLKLSPDQIFSPEVLGSAVDLHREAVFTVPYESDDDMRAGYGMLDVPLARWLRVVGGIRLENWHLNLYNGTREAPVLEPTRRRNTDLLGSVNLTFKVSERQNVRLGLYETVARPDPREVSPDQYFAVTGDCGYEGNPLLRRSKIRNADVRWELYPDAGELVSVSAFFKDFTDAIGEVLAFTGSATCLVQFENFETAYVGGGELELRKALTFLPGPLARLGAGLNVTAVKSTATVRVDSARTITYKLQGQSDRLVNLNLTYTDQDRGFDASLLLNHFSDRIVRYGITSISDAAGIVQVPSVIEKGRLALDAKIRKRIGASTVSLSARNLTDSEVIFYQPWDGGRTRTGYNRPGISVSMRIGYAF